MHAALAPFGHQTGPLQQAFYPTVAQLHLVLGHQLLVKVAHVQVEILLPVQLQYLLHLRQRHPLGRRLAPPPVIQTANPELLVALPPAPHLPVANADDFCCLPPRDLPGDGSQNHFFYFHGPLHRGLAVRDHVLHALLPLPPAKRTLHVLFQPDISCATDTAMYRNWQFPFYLLACFAWQELEATQEKEPRPSKRSLDGAHGDGYRVMVQRLEHLRDPSHHRRAYSHSTRA